MYVLCLFREFKKVHIVGIVGTFVSVWFVSDSLGRRSKEISS
jgi:hypothetical protein